MYQIRTERIWTPRFWAHSPKREREREGETQRERERHIYMYLHICICMYISIHVYVLFCMIMEPLKPKGGGPFIGAPWPREPNLWLN